MLNITSLRDDLASEYEKLINKNADVETVKLKNQTAQSIIQTIKVELSNAKLNDIKPNIDFLNNTDKK